MTAQQARCELVDGEIVAIAEAGRRHDVIVVNLTTAIHSQMREGPCQMFSGDTYVATSVTTRRMPDLGVDCEKPEETSLMADEPVLVIEVLSPTAGGFASTWSCPCRRASKHRRSRAICHLKSTN